MVALDGVLYTVHKMLADSVVDRDSPLYEMRRLAFGNAETVGRGIRAARGMQLRLSAAFLPDL